MPSLPGAGAARYLCFWAAWVCCTCAHRGRGTANEYSGEIG